MSEETQKEKFTNRIEQIEKILLETAKIQKKIEFNHKREQVENKRWREENKRWREESEERWKKADERLERMDAHLEHLSKLAGVSFERINSHEDKFQKIGEVAREDKRKSS